jgi:hypothetical protein
MTRPSSLVGPAAIFSVTVLYACAGSHVLPAASPQQYESRSVVRDESTPQPTTVAVHLSQVGPPVTRLVAGATIPAWYNLTLSGISQAVAASNLAITRFPAGAQVDIYDWRSGKDGPRGTPCAGNANPLSNIDTFMRKIALPAHTQVSLGVNYGSNPRCDGPNTPANAAAFVSHVINRYGAGVVSFWELGNEQYAPGSIDCRQPRCRSSRDPDQFAANEPAFYDAMHAAGAQNVCIPVDAANPKSRWNSVVFEKAKYDCANIVYYPQRVETSDSFLLYQAIPQLKTQIAAVKAELAAAGRADTPILLSAISSALGPYGKQSQSIVGALYADMAIGEALNDGVAGMIWHIGVGSCDARSEGGDFARTVYGWQNYGGAMMFSDGPANNCPVTAPRGTLLATANAFVTAGTLVNGGGNMVGVTVNGNPNVRAYASTQAIMLVNLSEKVEADVTITVDGKNGGFGGAVVNYDKALYDQSKTGIWAAPRLAPLLPWVGHLHVRLRRWSVTVAPLGTETNGHSEQFGGVSNVN